VYRVPHGDLHQARIAGVDDLSKGRRSNIGLIDRVPRVEKLPVIEEVERLAANQQGLALRNADPFWRRTDRCSGFPSVKHVASKIAVTSSAFSRRTTGAHPAEIGTAGPGGRSAAGAVEIRIGLAKLVGARIDKLLLGPRGNQDGRRPHQ
jgi:hypothetical protein